jgi:3-mercaptopyruvate sulfurtransferase SseA
MVENRKNPFPWALIAAGALLVIVGLGWLILKQPSTPEITPTPAFVEQVERVTLEDARAAFDQGNAIFLDVRAESSYAVSHIPTAISIPINELPARLGELDPAAWIIPY